MVPIRKKLTIAALTIILTIFFGCDPNKGMDELFHFTKCYGIFQNIFVALKRSHNSETLYSNLNDHLYLTVYTRFPGRDHTFCILIMKIYLHFLCLFEEKY